MQVVWVIDEWSLHWYVQLKGDDSSAKSRIITVKFVKCNISSRQKRKKGIAGFSEINVSRAQGSISEEFGYIMFC